MKRLIFTIAILVSFFTAYSQDTINVPGDYTTIQAAIDAADNGDIVLVAEDTYYENINFSGKAITVASQFLIDGDTSHISNTIINGSQPSNPDSGSVVYFVSGEDTTSVICGFTITGGSGHDGYYGGGIYCENAGAKIIFNKITWNETSGLISMGGGIYSDADSTQYWIVIENNLIKSNHVIPGGRFTQTCGGGIYISRMNGKICNNIISKNNCVPSISDSQGGGIYIDECSPFIVNNTIIDNTAKGGPQHPNATGGISVNGGQPIIMNNIIWGNTGTEEISNNMSVFYCDVEGGYTGIGNIDSYPEFVDTANGDYHLSDNSLCIGAGIDSLEIGGRWYFCPMIDFEGNPRPNPPSTMPDMGAYEFGLPVGVEDELIQIPKEYFLAQNYPNPFNPTTKIKYSVPQSSNVVIKVFDILGNEIEILVNEEKPAGSYEVDFDASELTSGIYFYGLQAGSFVETKKMVLMK